MKRDIIKEIKQASDEELQFAKDCLRGTQLDYPDCKITQSL